MQLFKYKTYGLGEQMDVLIIEEKEADISYLTKLLKTRISENNYALRIDEKTLREGTEGQIEIVEIFYQKLYSK